MSVNHQLVRPTSLWPYPQVGLHSTHFGSHNDWLHPVSSPQISVSHQPTPTEFTSLLKPTKLRCPNSAHPYCWHLSSPPTEGYSYTPTNNWHTSLLCKVHWYRITIGLRHDCLSLIQRHCRHSQRNRSTPQLLFNAYGPMHKVSGQRYSAIHQ